MEANIDRRSRVVQIFALLVAGLGIGWLCGLSASPVVGGVVASLVGVGAGLITALQTVRPGPGRGPGEKVQAIADPIPAAIVILGIAVAAPAGILARTHHIFEPPSAQAPGVSKATETAYQGVLFGNRVTDCEKLAGLAARGEVEAFRGELRNSSAAGKALADKVQDFGTLRLLVEAVCSTD